MNPAWSSQPICQTGAEHDDPRRHSVRRNRHPAAGRDPVVIPPQVWIPPSSRRRSGSRKARIYPRRGIHTSHDHVAVPAMSFLCLHNPAWLAEPPVTLHAPLLTIVPRVLSAGDLVWADLRGLPVRETAERVRNA